MSFCRDNLACFKSLNCLRRIESELESRESSDLERQNSKILELLASVRRWTLNTAAEAASSCSRRKKSSSVPDVAAVHHVPIDRILSWPETSSNLDSLYLDKNNLDKNNLANPVDLVDTSRRRRLRPSSTIVTTRTTMTTTSTSRYPVRRRVTCTMIDDVAQVRRATNTTTTSTSTTSCSSTNTSSATTDSKTTQTDFELDPFASMRPVVVLRRHKSESRHFALLERAGSSSRLVIEKSGGRSSRPGVVCVGCQERLAHHLDRLTEDRRVARPLRPHPLHRGSLGALHVSTLSSCTTRSGCVRPRPQASEARCIRGQEMDLDAKKEEKASSIITESEETTSNAPQTVAGNTPRLRGQKEMRKTEMLISKANNHVNHVPVDSTTNATPSDSVVRVTSKLSSSRAVNTGSVESQIRALSNGATRIHVPNHAHISQEVKNEERERSARLNSSSVRGHRVLCKSSDVNVLNELRTTRKPCWNLVMETTSRMAEARTKADRIGPITSSASSMAWLAPFRLPQDVEDFYCDDEVSATDPNLQLSISNRDELDNDNRRYPNHPLLQDQESILSMDVASTGPTSLRSNVTDDTSDDLVGVW